MGRLRWSNHLHPDWMGISCNTKEGMGIRWYGPNGEDHGVTLLMSQVDMAEEAARRDGDSPEWMALRHELASIIEQLEEVSNSEPKSRRL